jgi:hypothetical protein
MSYIVILMRFQTIYSINYGFIHIYSCIYLDDFSGCLFSACTCTYETTWIGIRFGSRIFTDFMLHVELHARSWVGLEISRLTGVTCMSYTYSHDDKICPSNILPLVRLPLPPRKKTSRSDKRSRRQFPLCLWQGWLLTLWRKWNIIENGIQDHAEPLYLFKLINTPAL